ncbi:MAG: hypothetical protein P1U89_24135 [Verrucomicrobiales bacterium]|nr:hypothetical protein [Verrucomicrobiales bacterium]
MINSEEKEFQELLQQAVDGCLTNTEGRRLQELARGNRERLEELVDHSLIASLLFEESGDESVGDLVDFLTADGPPDMVNAKRLVNRQSLAIAAALAVLLAVGSLFFSRSNAPDTAGRAEIHDNSVAQLTESVGVRWESGGGPIAGAALAPGILQIAEGIARIDFYSGARLVVEGPAELEIVSAYSAWCRSGRIRAHVPEQARGFKIFTPSFELVDLGTEFGMDVSKDGAAQVRVFDGEVELFSPMEKQSVLGGQEVKISPSGESAPVLSGESNGDQYPTFSDLQTRATQAAATKLERWRSWNRSLAGDQRVVARFDFEKNSTPEAVVVGCSPAEGRWPGKGALEFRRPGDRVRVNIPGKFNALTLAAWIRVDTLPQRRQALLLTDEYRIAHLHWQIGLLGEVRFGAKLKEGVRRREFERPASPVLFDMQQIGVWNFICTSFDRETSSVCHYFNGQKVSTHKFVFGQPLQIGSGDIGNWSVPINDTRKVNPVRNFVGRMDELTIWNVALEPDEIAEVYNQYKP